MINYKAKLPLKDKAENVECARMFLRDLLVYVTNDTDCQEFHEWGDIYYDTIKNQHVLGFQWKTGDSFSLTYTNVVSINSIPFLEFTFKRRFNFEKEIGVMKNGDPMIVTESESKATGLMFYVKYIDDSFSARTTNDESTKTNDFGFITNEIAKELGKYPY